MNIARVGDIYVLVDSGAKLSVVRYDQIDSLFQPIGSVLQGLVTAGDGSMIVMGELTLLFATKDEL